MRTVLYRRWAPAASPIRIEFASDVLHEIRAEQRGEHDRGYLFGRRSGVEVRILRAVREPYRDDPRIQGMEPLGVYSARPRGAVFLTDDDLAFLARIPDGLALVVAGVRAGFFVREQDGSLQAVRSHEEFSVAEAAPQAEAPAALTVPTMPAWLRHPALPPVRTWQWIAGAAAVLALPLGAATFLQPQMQQPMVEMNVHESNGQLVMRWDPQALRSGGRLEIEDGKQRVVLALAAYVGEVTYATGSSDVDVRLTTPTRSSVVHWKSGRAH